MWEWLSAPAIMTGLGLLFGTILAVAYRLLKVEVDPRVQGTVDRLPGSNCGACGEPGCAPFAQKLVAGEIQISRCTVASEHDIDAIAEMLGVDAGEQDRLVARLHCAGGQQQAYQIAEYQGFDSCRAAAVVSGGGKGCAWGCLGLADCEVVCDFNAIIMNDNGLPVVEPEKCTACGDCVDSCPKDLFELLPVSQRLLVQCKIPLAGEMVTNLCSVGCDGCGKCAADGPSGTITMQDELPIINYLQLSQQSQDNKPTQRCPTGAIVWLNQSPTEMNHLSANSDRYAQFS